MKINYAQQSSFQKLCEIKFDIIICASGYETRSRFFYSKFSNINQVNLNKFCFLFQDRKVFSREINETFYLFSGFNLVEFQDNNLIDSVENYKKIFSTINKKKIDVVVDYSCMTKVMYASLIKYFALLDDTFESVNIFFSYSPALYSEPTVAISNLHNQPIALFPKVQSTDKDIALLVSLGYEEGKAHGLIEYFQIDCNDMYLFYTSKAEGDKYYEKVIDHNDYLMKKVPFKNQFEYDLNNVTQIFSLLESLCVYLLSNSYRVIVAPLGPKVFSLISILLTSKYNELTVFRVSDGIKGKPVDKLPDEEKDFIIMEVNFLNKLN